MTTREHKVVSLTAQNTFTDVLTCDLEDEVSVSVSGVSDSTVTLQRRFNGADWRDVIDFSANEEGSYTADEACELRLGIKTGDYGSDTVICRIGKG